MADKDRTRILGDINPRSRGVHDENLTGEEINPENEESMVGGSRHDRSEHAGCTRW